MLYNTVSVLVLVQLVHTIVYFGNDNGPPISELGLTEQEWEYGYEYKFVHTGYKSYNATSRGRRSGGHGGEGRMIRL